MGRALKAALITSALVLALPGAASAATKVYAGDAEIGGQVAMDVKVSKAGAAKRITGLRAVDLPATCEISGGPIPVHMDTAPVIKVSKRGKFDFEFTDTYDNTSTLSGKFKGRKDKRVVGEFLYADHFPAEDSFPEEDCATEKTKFEAEKGAPDIDLPQRHWR